MNPSPRHPRLFCPTLPHPRLSESRAMLDAEQTRHLRKVLRGREGDTIELFNGQGLTATSTVLGFDAGFTWCQVVDAAEHPEPRPRLTVAAALPKGPLADTMVSLLSQAGADLLVPLRSQRSVVDPRESKVDRLSKLAVESAKQCGRAWGMGVAGPTDLGKALRQTCDLGLVMDPRGEPIADLPQRVGRAEHVTLVVGPEGGLTDQELRDADNAGFLRWSVGPNILRIETAATAGTAILRYIAQP